MNTSEEGTRGPDSGIVIQYNGSHPAPIPDQVLTPLSADDDIPRLRVIAFLLNLGADEDAAVRDVDALIAAIRAPLEARIAYLSGEDSQLVARILFLEGELAAALAGVPKEAGCETCVAFGWRADQFPADSEVHATTPEKYRADVDSGRGSWSHPFNPGVVAAPVEDAK